MKKTKAIVIMLLLSFMAASIFTVTMVPWAHGAATIWSDKPDYSPGDTVVISGSGFLANVWVTITVSRPDSTTDTIYALTDGSGALIRNYPLDGTVGTYTVTATDGTNRATTTFTDQNKYFTSIIGPTAIGPGQTATYTIVITNDPTSSNGAWLGSALITIPFGFASVSITSLVATGGKSWTASIISGKIKLQADTPQNRLDRGESISVSFSTTAPSTTGTYVWTTTAYTNPSWAGDLFDLVGSQPTVTVGYNVHLDSMQDTSASSNLGTITLGGTSYSLPSDVIKAANSYSAAFFPAGGYVFDHWAATLGVTVSGTSDNPTTVTVNGDGTLRAYYKAAPSGSVSITITSSPVTGLGLNAK